MNSVTVSPIAQKALSFILGALLGGSLGYVIGKKIADTMEEKESQNVWSLQDILDRTDDISEKDAPSELPNLDETDEGKNFPKAVTGMDYGKAFQKGPSLVRPSLASLSNKDEAAKLNFRIIGVEELLALESQDDYNQTDLTYYSLDSVLVNNEGKQAEYPELVVGREALNSFGVKSDSKDIVYVVDESQKTIYEIVRVEESYHEEILGWIDDTKKEAPGEVLPEVKKPQKKAAANATTKKRA